MVSQQIIDIIIKAEDRASQQAEKVKDKIKGLGDTSKNAMTNASNATYKFNTDLLKANNSLGVVGSGAAQASNLLGQMKLDPNFGSTMDRAKLSVSEMGYSLDSAKGKFMVLKTASSTVWDNIKSKVNSTGQSIKSKIGGAVDSIKNKLKGVSNAFSNLSAGAKTAGGGLGFLSNAASMAAGMIGYDLLNSVMETTRASLNARGSIQSFGSRLNMSGTEVSKFQSDLDKLQGSFKKVDMDIVGQQAMDMAYRLNLPKESLSQLTETSAIFTDAMARNGRSAEDATLALADAMDGEFRRLKEIGISQEDLKNNGWSGDINDKTRLLTAMNQALKDQHYDVLAKSVDSLDDAWKVLSITLGNLVESILVPLTPMIVGLIDMITGFVDAFKNMPDWAKIALGIGAIGLAFGLLASAAAAAEMTIGTFIVSLMPEFVASLFAAAGGLGAVSVAGAPLWLIVGAIAAVAIAAFEVGKAFGWWHDVGSMIEAISAGVQRLWRMLMNNKQVKQFIKELGDAWNWVCDALKPVVDWAKKVWDDLFPDSANGKFDIVRSIAEAFGWVGRRVAGLVGAAKSAWNSFMGFINYLSTTGGIIGVVRDALKGIVCILLGCSPGIVPALRTVQEVFTSVWNAIVGFVTGVVSSVINALRPIIDILTEIGDFIIGQFTESWNAFLTIVNVISIGISNIINAFSMFINGQISIQTLFSMIWNTISSVFFTVTAIINQRLFSFASALLGMAITAGSNLLNGIISYVTQLPGRIWVYLVQVTTRVITAGRLWVNKARAMAQQLVTGVITFISQLPGRMYTYLHQVVSKIISAGSQWVSNAKSKAQSVVSNAVSAVSGLPGKISSAISGVVDAFTKPFRDAWNNIKSYVDKINDVADMIPSFGGESANGRASLVVAYGGEEADGRISLLSKDSSTGTTTNEPIRVEEDIKLTLDLKNVPSTMDTSSLIEALTEKQVLEAIVGNRTFQDLDAKIKQKMELKTVRARGM